MQTPTGKPYLEAIIQRIDGDRAVLLLPDGQIIRWPLSLLKADRKPGDTVHVGVDVSPSAPSTSSAHDLAHTVLNEIFAPRD